MRKVIYLFFASFLASRTFACSFDTDCQVGSKCIKPPDSLSGVCAGGLYPGNDNDRRPAYVPVGLDKTYVNTCSFDSDCGLGCLCVKSDGITGTCMAKDEGNYLVENDNKENNKPQTFESKESLPLGN